MILTLLYLTNLQFHLVIFELYSALFFSSHDMGFDLKNAKVLLRFHPVIIREDLHWFLPAALISVRL